ncbi:MAG TPA: hypothetical protein ENH05_07360 [Rhizobiales bacterium]|nr:hypothetical protein BMS3Bbin10_01632 [bacterium BMS3Bbin10]HDO52539.1 hypothetical protein [Hyphomicrobiales bacterium]
MLLSLPYLILSVIAYNAIVFMTGTSFETIVFQVPMMSGAMWTFTLSDMLITGTLFLLFIEILKATRTSGNSLVDHALSTIVFIICIIEFLVVPEAATSLFFFITLITLIDVIAGFSVTIRAARRDFAVGPQSF